MAPKPVGIVTGAAHGIGKGIADKLLMDGWRLVLIDAPDSPLDVAFSKCARNAALMEGDVADEQTGERAVALALKQFGRLDAVVSNAGIMKRTPLAKLTLTEWHRTLDVNLTAFFLLARAAEKALRKSKGAMVSIASTRAQMSEPDTLPYSATKGGLVALTHALAISLAPDVRVNCVSPGWIEVEDYSKLRKKDHEQHPAGRVGKPSDIAEMVAFLLDKEKSGFVTGANFTADGGMTRKMIYEE